MNKTRPCAQYVDVDNDTLEVHDLYRDMVSLTATQSGRSLIATARVFVDDFARVWTASLPAPSATSGCSSNADNGLGAVKLFSYKDFVSVCVKDRIVGHEVLVTVRRTDLLNFFSDIDRYLVRGAS